MELWNIGFLEQRKQITKERKDVLILVFCRDRFLKFS